MYFRQRLPLEPLFRTLNSLGCLENILSGKSQNSRATVDYQVAKLRTIVDGPKSHDDRILIPISRERSVD